MSQSNDETLRQLRAALEISPDNIPLRAMIAGILLKNREFRQAETEFREALRYDPDNSNLKLGLAETFFALDLVSQCEVLLDDLLKLPSPPPAALILQARVLLNNGDELGAARYYFEALRLDESLQDPELNDRLGALREAAPSQGPSPSEFAGDDSDEEFGMPGMMASSGATIEPEKSDTSFKDVGGMEAVKDEIRMKIILPMQQPEMFAAYGKKAGGGILLYGPPGCGKTWLARATAGEINANFLSVGIHDVLDMWVGSSERNLHAIFEQARNSAPCVLFFDEVDALGADRTDMRAHGSRHLINQFLAELDGMASNNGNVLVLAATNAPWHLDSAFRRPGRFDRILFVPPPDEAARAAILELHLQGKPLGKMDLNAVARKTDKFSGADLKALVDVATEEKLREALKKGRPSPIQTRDLKSALRSVKASTVDWFSSARNYALYSNVGGQYDDILEYLKLNK